MPFNPDIHHRRSIRLKDYDYTRAGAYFVTICAWQRECLFGTIVDGEMRLNELGRVVESVWTGLPGHYTGIELDEYTIMPNHFHGIVIFTDCVGAGLGPPDVDPPLFKKGAASRAPTLGDVICAFKSISAIQINKLRANPGCPIWQRNYFERVIRNEAELTKAREYIANNPLKWELDKNHPRNACYGTTHYLAFFIHLMNELPI